MRKLFWPLLVLTVFVGARHLVLTAYFTNRTLRLNFNRAAKQTDTQEQATYLEEALNSLQSYRGQLNLFRFTDRNIDLGRVNHIENVLKKMRQDAKFSVNPEKIAKGIAEELRRNAHLSVAVMSSDGKLYSMIAFWILAVLTLIAGLLQTFSPPD